MRENQQRTAMVGSIHHSELYRMRRPCGTLTTGPFMAARIERVGMYGAGLRRQERYRG